MGYFSTPIAESDVTSLVTDLTSLLAGLSGKAASSHTHAESDVTNLPTDLAGKFGTFKLRTGLFYAPAGLLSANATAITNQRIAATPFWVPNAITLTSIGLEVTIAGQAGSTIALAIYSDDATGGWPGARLLNAGTINGASATYQSIAVSQALTPGLIWLAANVVTSGTVPTIRLVTSGFQAVGHNAAATISANAAVAPQRGSQATPPDPWGGTVGDFTTGGPRIVLGF